MFVQTFDQTRKKIVISAMQFADYWQQIKIDIESADMGTMHRVHTYPLLRVIIRNNFLWRHQRESDPSLNTTQQHPAFPSYSTYA